MGWHTIDLRQVTDNMPVDTVLFVYHHARPTRQPGSCILMRAGFAGVPADIHHISLIW